MKKHIKTIVMMLFFVVLLVGFYFALSKRNREETSPEINAAKKAEEMTPTQKLLAEAAYREYPSTPVQLLKYYNEFMLCFYNDEYSEDELKALGLISRKLMDEELVANQSEVEFYNQLKLDIANLRSQGDNGTSIYKIEVTPSMDVEYFEHDGYECARLYDTFTMKQMLQGSLYYPVVRYVYVMRKDAEGHWRIFGFQKAEEEEESGESTPQVE